jgi:hypothetical protein
MKNEKAYKNWRDKQKSQLKKKLDEQLYNNLPRKKASNADDINIKKYRESYRGDSPLDD